MGVLAKLSVTDDVTSTFKEIRKQNKSLKEEMHSTGEQLKETWDHKYKPIVDSTSAMKAIRNLQSGADKFKEGVNTQIRLNDEDMRKLNKAKAKLNAFGNMVASPFIKIKEFGTKQIQTITMKLQRLGGMVITPIVKVRDMALSKLKSSIKLFEQVKNFVMDPILNVKDRATSKISLVTIKLKVFGASIYAPVLQAKDRATSVIKKASIVAKDFGSFMMMPLIAVKDFATPRLVKLKDNLLFLAKLSIQPAIKLVDYASAGVQKIKSALRSIPSKAYSALVTLKDSATSKASAILGKLKSIGHSIVSPVVNLKDNISSKINPITSKLKTLGKMNIQPVAKILDKTGSVLSSIGSKIASFGKGIIIPVTASVAAVGFAVNSGKKLEQQQVSVEHFIGTTNKDYSQDQIKAAASEFTSALRANANATPFETSEVIQAGSRAIALTQGNLGDAMKMVKLAEDMSAASGGTASVQDAIEALGDAKMGEMERLKNFGFKVSADDFEKKGFSGVSNDLQDFFGGASEKLSTTGGGLISTIMGKTKSGIADFGLNIVEQLKPVLTDIIGFIDKSMPVIQEVGIKFGDGIGNGIKFISSMMPGFISGFKQMMPTFSAIISGIQQMLPPIMAFAGTVGQTIKSVIVQAAPVIDTIVQAIARVLPAVEPIFSRIVTCVGNIVSTILPPLGTAFSMIADVIVAISPVVMSVFDGICTYIEGAIGGITSIIGGGLDLISAIWNGDWQGICDAVGTIMGGVGEILKAPINAIIGILNGAIDAINSVSVDIPDWIPGIGGQHWGLDLGKIDYLAKGGIVNKATPAIVGEAGKEAVMPLENNTGWISQLADKINKRPKRSTPMPSGSKLTAPELSTPKPPKEEFPTPNPVPRQPSGGQVINKTYNITLAKVADEVIVRNESDINSLTEKIAEKIIEIAENLD